MKLTVNGDVDALGHPGPDGSRDREADLTGEMGVLVLLQYPVLQGALHRVEASVLPGHQGDHVYLWNGANTATNNVKMKFLTQLMQTFVAENIRKLDYSSRRKSHRGQNLRPTLGTSGSLSLYQVMLGLGNPFRTSHDATWRGFCTVSIIQIFFFWILLHLLTFRLS